MFTIVESSTTMSWAIADDAEDQPALLVMGIVAGEDKREPATVPAAASAVGRGRRVIMARMATIAPGNRTLPDTSDFRRQAFIDGAFVDAAAGATFACVSPVAARRCSTSPRATARTSTARSRSRGARSRRASGRGWRRASGGGAAPPRRPDRARPRPARADDHARHGQADQRRAGRGRRRGGVLPLLRRGGRQGLRRGRPDRPVGGHAGHARGDRRGRRWWCRGTTRS